MFTNKHWDAYTRTRYLVQCVAMQVVGVVVELGVARVSECVLLRLGGPQAIKQRPGVRMQVAGQRLRWCVVCLGAGGVHVRWPRHFFVVGSHVSIWIACPAHRLLLLLLLLGPLVGAVSHTVILWIKSANGM